MESMSVEERLALLEERLASPGTVPARVIQQSEEDEVPPEVRLAQFRRERAALLAETKGKPSAAQERRLAALDKAILAVASPNEPEVYLAALRREREFVAFQSTQKWQPEHAGQPGALSQEEHDRRVRSARGALTEIDSQIKYTQKQLEQLCAAL